MDGRIERRMFWITTAALVAFTAACGGVEDEGRGIDDDAVCSTVDPARELMIRDLAVVNDAVRTRWTGATTSASDGAWHFGRLMTNMAGSQDPSDFVLAWLRTWESARTVNGQTVAARPAIRSLVTNAWPRLANGKLDLTRAPFRLLAIVNRIDLRNLARGHAGEGRFVFGVLDAAGNPTSFTVILEYALPATTQADVTRWANDWHNLGALTRGSAAYRTALQAITDRFAGRNASPTSPNGSALHQLRTDEIALDAPWQLREFRISGTTGRLVEVTVAQTPSGALNGTTRFRDYVNQNSAAIIAGRYTIPLSFEAQPFRAGAIENNIDFWSAPGITSNRARHLVSLNTCNGCHGGETGTGFLHVSNRAANQVAQLSGFLTGTTVTDPVNPAVTRTFNDLRRRANDLHTLVCPTAADASAPVAEEDQLGARVH